jgi:hypothetical protein
VAAGGEQVDAGGGGCQALGQQVDRGAGHGHEVVGGAVEGGHRAASLRDQHLVGAEVCQNWTLLAFVLLLFHGDSILAFAAEQLHQRRAYRLRLEQERTRQALIGHDRDALVWRQLDGPDLQQDAPTDRT